MIILAVAPDSGDPGKKRLKTVRLLLILKGLFEVHNQYVCQRGGTAGERTATICFD